MINISYMFDPCIIIPYNILVLKSALNVNFSFNSFIVFVIFFAHFYHFNAIYVSINQISHFEDFSTSSLTNHLYLLKILSVSFIWNDWKIESVLFLLLKNLIILILHNELIFQIFFIFEKRLAIVLLYIYLIFGLFKYHFHYIIILQLLPPYNVLVHLVSNYFLFLFNFEKLLLN